VAKNDQNIFNNKKIFFVACNISFEQCCHILLMQEIYEKLPLAQSRLMLLGKHKLKTQVATSFYNDLTLY
jgi:hypothetical protein